MEAKTSTRIMAGTDFSAAADRAVVPAAMLAAERSAELTIVHVEPRLDRDSLARLVLGGPPEAGSGAEVERQLADTLALARAHAPTATFSLVKGGPPAMLASEAERLGADLVVVGVRGERSLKNTMIGTTAERLMERWPRDILVVRKAPTAPYQSILACVALAPQSCTVVRSAVALSDHASLHLFHAYAPAFEAKLVGHAHDAAAIARYRAETRRRAAAALSELLEQCSTGRPFVTVVRYGNPSALIRHTAVRQRVDAIVLGRSQSALDELLLGSVTKKVVRTVPCDVLIAGVHSFGAA